MAVVVVAGGINVVVVVDGTNDEVVVVDGGGIAVEVDVDVDVVDVVDAMLFTVVVVVVVTDVADVDSGAEVDVAPICVVVVLGGVVIVEVEDRVGVSPAPIEAFASSAGGMNATVTSCSSTFSETTWTPAVTANTPSRMAMPHWATLLTSSSTIAHPQTAHAEYSAPRHPVFKQDLYSPVEPRNRIPLCRNQSAHIRHYGRPWVSADHPSRAQSPGTGMVFVCLESLVSCDCGERRRAQLSKLRHIYDGKARSGLTQQPKNCDDHPKTGDLFRLDV
jgi:hypothetical protein